MDLYKFDMGIVTRWCACFKWTSYFLSVFFFSLTETGVDGIKLGAGVTTPRSMHAIPGFVDARSIGRRTLYESVAKPPQSCAQLSLTRLGLEPTTNRCPTVQYYDTSTGFTSRRCDCCCPPPSHPIDAAAVHARPSHRQIPPCCCRARQERLLDGEQERPSLVAHRSSMALTLPPPI
jgi:hypothetical protein